MPIPINRIVDLLDKDFSKNDYESAEKHLIYWGGEAESEHDERGLLFIFNEKMGLYRKIGRENEAILNAENALSLIEKTEMENTITAGTTFLNSATVYKAFGKLQKSVALFEKAEQNYRANLDKADARFGGLYNNMGLTYADLGEFEKARELFFKALSVMEQAENGEGEQAITWLNIADTYDRELGADGEEKVGEALTKAEELLNTTTLPQNGNTAYIFEKCAPVYGFYGWFATENELNERAKAIYERS